MLDPAREVRPDQVQAVELGRGQHAAVRRVAARLEQRFRRVGGEKLLKTAELGV